jgi:hypothetical protein
MTAFASSPSPAAPQTARRGRLRRWLGNGPKAERRTLAAIAGVILTVWLVVIFGRAIADSNALTQRQQQEAAINAQLQAQVDAGRQELEFIKTPPFLQFQARAVGMGAAGAGERAFALEPGAPSPAPLTPLGADHPQTDTSTPIEDWLHLLFGN